MLFTLDYRTIKFPSKAGDNMTCKSMFTRSVCNFPLYFQLSNHTSMQPCRASDISRKKNQNFAGFSRANLRKNRPISREKSQISKDFQGQILRKIGRFHGKFRGGKLRQETINKKQPISLDFFGQISVKSINFASI